MNQDLPRSSHDGELASAVLVALAILFAVLTAPSVPNQNLVRDLAPPGGAGLGSLPADFVEAGSQVLFAGSNGYGNELWRSDGTATGTFLVADLAPGAESSTPRDLRALGTILFFTVDVPGLGREPWRTDGTPQGLLSR